MNDEIKWITADVTQRELDALREVVEYLKYLAGDELRISAHLRQIVVDSECALSALRDGLVNAS